MKPTRFFPLAVAICSLALMPARAAFVLSRLFSFSPSPLSGEYAFGPLVQANDGNFYGTTEEGGTSGYGTVFRITPAGGYATLVPFNYSNGAYPIDGLLLGRDGNLYGTTIYGGANYYGTVFRISTNGTFATLASFTASGGYYPYAKLVQGTDGNFYGTTSQGGASAVGTVFRMTPAGVLTTMASFNHLNGASPYAGLIQGSDGNFYGTTTAGGSYGQGTIFEMTTNGVLLTLASFQDSGGFSLGGLVQGPDGSFYGAGSAGGGAGNGGIFKLGPDGVLTNLVNLQLTNGVTPIGGLTLGLDGNLYGTAIGGGANGSGTVFKVGLDGTFTKLGDFGSTTGMSPYAAPVQGRDGNLYGTTYSGGANNLGALYRLSITNVPLQIIAQPQTQMTFVGDNPQLSVTLFGSFPVSYQWFMNGTNLVDGGNLSGSMGRVLSWTNVNGANAGVYSVVVSNSFGAVTSAPAWLEVIASPPFIITQPSSQIVLAGATVVFNVEAGGDAPLTYQWQKNGTNLTDGGIVSGSASRMLILSGVSAADQGSYSVLVSDSLYWASSSGASLTLAPAIAPGITFASLYSFTAGNDGYNPRAGLTLSSSGLMYGTTEWGGSAGYGTAFTLGTNGGFATLVTFNGSNAYNPEGSLLQAADGDFYGTAAQSGVNIYGSGTIFKMTPGGTATALYSFTGGSDGSTPYDGLVQGVDGALYGTTLYGGIDGTAFKITTNGVLGTLYTFMDGNDGGAPYAGLIQALDGNFYGTTSEGGTNGNGTIFKLTPEGSLSTLYSFQGANDGAAPRAGLLQAQDGSLYGATYQGGAAGDGTIFRITTNGVFTTLFQFSGTNGSSPYGGLAQAGDGNFYGTTAGGGVGGEGSVFRMDTNGTLTTLVWFNEVNGATPYGTLIQGADGAFYGTTYNGGTFHYGTVFRLYFPVPAGIVKQPANQVSFQGSTVTFNVAAAGSGTLSYEWLFDGTNLTDGNGISGSATPSLTISDIGPLNVGTYSVVVSNTLGSVTSLGAQLSITSAPPSIVSQSSSQTVLSGATVTLGVTVVGNMPMFFQWHLNSVNLADGGNLTGSAASILTISNVSPSDAGTYSLSVSNALGSASSKPIVLTVTPVTIAGIALTPVYWASGDADGANPNGVVQGTNGLFYGTTQTGGSNSFGTVFQMTPNGQVATLFSFTGYSDGGYPMAGLVQGADGDFYGTASAGGTGGGWGTVFKISPAGAMTTLHTFAGGAGGGFPYAALAQGNDGNYYGTTLSGGTNQGWGTAFAISPGGSFGTLHSFTGGNDGGSPQGNLICGLDGNYYGSAPDGGAGSGTVFRMSSLGTVTPVYTFTGPDGSSPYGTVIQARDGNLYGTTAYGGTNNVGTVFRMTTNGLLTALYSFTGGSDGGSPYAGVVQASDGNLYGTTSDGGVYGDGTVFQITTNGTLTTLAWFDGFNGATPDTAMIQSADGSLYGATQYGGPNDNGVIFRVWVPSLTPPLAFHAPAMMEDGSLKLSWNSVAGRLYQLQWVSDLSATNWAGLGSSILATNAVTATSDIVAPDSQRFYRVLTPAP